MSDPSPLPPSSVPPPPSFALDFNPYVGGAYNREFGGKGTLTVQPDEPRFIFRGRPRRGLFISKETAELALRSDQISNVAVVGTGISFVTPVGKCGAKRQPFVFDCGSADDAAVLARILPATQDDEFRAGAAFTERLRQLPDGASGRHAVTTWLIAANVTAFIALGFAGAGWIEAESLRPYILYGANNATVTTNGEWWRLLACMFLHYGVLHLLLNQWALFQAGFLVERLLGRRLFALTYFGSGLLGSLATLHWNGDRVWSAGASGAVFGVYGALLGYILREKHAVPRAIFQPLLKSTLAFAGYNLFFGAVHPNIDNAAHLGGLVGGGLLGGLAALPLEDDARRRLFPSRFRATALVALVLIGAGAATAPRFDYRLTDEVAWDDASRAFIAREKTLLARREPVVSAYSKTGRPDELLAWLDDTARNYQGWHDALTALSFPSRFKTAQRREEFAPILQQKADAHAHFAAALRAGAPDAIARFNAEELTANAAIQAFHARHTAAKEQNASP